MNRTDVVTAILTVIVAGFVLGVGVQIYDSMRTTMTNQTCVLEMCQPDFPFTNVSQCDNCMNYCHDQYDKMCPNHDLDNVTFYGMRGW